MKQGILFILWEHGATWGGAVPLYFDRMAKCSALQTLYHKCVSLRRLNSRPSHCLESLGIHSFSFFKSMAINFIRKDLALSSILMSIHSVFQKLKKKSMPINSIRRKEWYVLFFFFKVSKFTDP